ncbi:fungal hydrophobin [Fistulina hepatica ATCC 64428]|uniref:Hydrophobin n=1 Tax=Fistulina hepatica ATCC 64428 TaxID=1128425 RepID=A0A0D7A8P0_9AGAR|nr:fungal hydrophobin [Fistulina hepatica ATCC 64428]
MFARIFFVFVVAYLAVTAAAGSTIPITVTSLGPIPTGIPVCSPFDTLCCDTVTTASNPAVEVLLGLLDIAIDPADAIVGLTCTPFSVLGGGPNGCSGELVCCENNGFDGAIAIGCTPIIVDP